MAASCTYHLPSSTSCSTRGKEKVFMRTIFLEEKKGEWKINRKMTGGKQQQDCAEEQKGRRSERGNAMKAMMCIPDRRETSAIPSLPSRELLTRQFSTRSVLCATVITPHASWAHSTACRLTQCLSNSSEKLKLIAALFAFKVCLFFYYIFFCFV